MVQRVSPFALTTRATIKIDLTVLENRIFFDNRK